MYVSDYLDRAAVARALSWRPPAFLSLGVELGWSAIMLAAAGYWTWIALAEWHVLPFWDQWATVIWFDWIVSGQRSLLDVLMMPHNEHRIIPTKLAFLGDLAFFKGRAILPYSVLVLATVGLWGALAAMASRGCARHLQLAVVASAGMAMVSPLQFDNLVMPFNLSWQFCGLVSLIAFYCTARCAEEPKRLWLFLPAAAVSTMLSVFSSANGLICAAIVFVMSLTLPIGKVAGITLATLAAASIALFFVGYPVPMGHQPFHASFGDVKGWINYLTFVVLMIGMPAYGGGTIVSAVSGLAGVAAFSVVLVVVLRRSRVGRLSDPGELALIATAAMGLMTAAITGVGRAEMGPTFAASGRYATFVLLFWMCLAALTIRLGRTLLGASLVLFILAGTYVSSHDIVAAVRTWVYATRIASADLRAGRPISGQIHPVLPDAAELARLVEFLRQHRLSIFAE